MNYFSPLYVNPTQFQKLEIWVVRGERSGHIFGAVNLYSHISGSCVWLGVKIWSPEFSFWSFSEHRIYVKL